MSERVSNQQLIKIKVRNAALSGFSGQDLCELNSELVRTYGLRKVSSGKDTDPVVLRKSGGADGKEA
jgi:hypothetical protein